jgi:hypothetical protein
MNTGPRPHEILLYGFQRESFSWVNAVGMSNWPHPYVWCQRRRNSPRCPLCASDLHFMLMCHVLSTWINLCALSYSVLCLCYESYSSDYFPKAETFNIFLTKAGFKGVNEETAAASMIVYYNLNCLSVSQERRNVVTSNRVFRETENNIDEISTLKNNISQQKAHIPRKQMSET